jgi:hypothetical protein
MRAHQMLDPVDHLRQVAKDVLQVFVAVEQKAKAELARMDSAGHADVFVESSSNRMGQAVDHSSRASGALAGIRQQLAGDLQQLAREPALIRVLAREESGEPAVYYISRVSPVQLPGSRHKFTSYRSPMGRMAAREVGDEVEIEVKGHRRSFEILEKLSVTPLKSAGWDGVDNVFELEGGTRRFAPSLNDLVAWQLEVPDEGDLLASLLDEQEVPRSVLDGARRKVLDRMELRDRPALDRFQDEIFRKPLDEQIMISGPPGSGKTTTLLKRLGQKLDLRSHDEDEEGLVARYEEKGGRPFRESWIMFTPTELLMLYLKEAFNKEGIAAPEQRLRTWSHHRRWLARDVVPILRSVDKGLYSQDDSRDTLSPQAIHDAPGWYDDFSRFHLEWAATMLLTAARHLVGSNNERAKMLGEQALRSLPSATGLTSPPVISALAVLALHNQRGPAEQLIADEKRQADEAVRAWLNGVLKKNRAALDELAALIDGDPEGVAQDEEDEDEDEDDEEKTAGHGTDVLENAGARRQRAFRVASTGLRSIARARRNAKQIRATSRAGKILVWMGEALPADADLRALGDRLALIRELRVLTRPVRLYTDRIPRVYAQFRRKRISEGSWYVPEAIDAVRRQAITGLEVDLLILTFLTRARELEERLTGARAEELDSGSHFEVVRALRAERRAQVLVDEATDFSPLQLRCMVALADPVTRAFYASGDLLQRVTAWGIRDMGQLRWVSSALEVHEVAIGYRQTRQLTEFADQLAALAGAPRTPVAMPSGSDSDGVPPALGEGLEGSTLVDWIACRVIEIQRRVGRFPSIAVLLHDEAEVAPVAAALAEQLRDHNAAVVACPQGRVVGSDGDVRVFDVQHIKGLEFEAALFAGVDKLLAAAPDLFDKLLYVGATRAATFLGIACAERLPTTLEPLRDRFVARWG